MKPAMLLLVSHCLCAATADRNTGLGGYVFIWRTSLTRLLIHAFVFTSVVSIATTWLRTGVVSGLYSSLETVPLPVVRLAIFSNE